MILELLGVAIIAIGVVVMVGSAVALTERNPKPEIEAQGRERVGWR